VRFDKLLGCLASFDQRNFIQGILQLVSREYLSAPVLLEDYLNWWKSDADVVSAVAGLIYLVLNDQDSRKTYLNSWLTSSSGAGVGEGIAIRRASVIALSRSKNDMESVFEKSLQQFRDQLYIRHTPIMQQEGIFHGPYYGKC
jgi:telomere length regulation protein